MRLTRIRLKNFRCYKNETAINFSPFTALVGKNDSGKSSIMEALAVFFGEGELESNDASIGGDAEDVRIVCEFQNLEPLILDAEHPTTFAGEHLLNRAGSLEIHKIFDLSGAKPKVKGVFINANHPTAEGFGDLLALKNAELKKRAQDLGINLDGVNRSINTAIRKKLWEGRDLALQERHLRIDDTKTKAVWEQIEAQLPVFALFKSDRPSTDQDAEAQDPMKAAIKEALKAKEAALEAIISHVQGEVQQIADATIRKLREMEPSLANELKPQFSKPNWSTVFKVALTGDGEIPVNKRGSGVRRLLLLNFFRAKAEQNVRQRTAPGVIYAIEEPETSQHPNVQIMLKDAFLKLAAESNCQILITTHTPMLARLIPMDSLRFIEGTGLDARRIHAGDEATYSLCAKSLGVLADHDVKLFFGVEGANDIAFMKGIAKVLLAAGEDVPNLEKLEEESRLVFILVGGSNLAHWAARLAGFNRPEYYLMDRDVRPPTASPKQGRIDEINARGATGKLTTKRELENYLHPDAIRNARGIALDPFDDFDDVPEIVARKIHEASGSPNAWNTLDPELKGKKTSNAKAWLNSEAITHMTPALLTEKDPAGEIRSWLTDIARIVRS